MLLSADVHKFGGACENLLAGIRILRPLSEDEVLFIRHPPDRPARLLDPLLCRGWVRLHVVTGWPGDDGFKHCILRKAFERDMRAPLLPGDCLASVSSKIAGQSVAKRTC